MVLRRIPRALVQLKAQTSTSFQSCRIWRSNAYPLRRAAFHTCPTLARDSHESRAPQTGTLTPTPEASPTPPKSHKPNDRPFAFQTAYAGWPKRPARPFPPPFFSLPSTSFSDPLSTYHQSRASRVDGVMMLGVTNGDDAMVATETFLGVMDGVGAWAMKERGCAALWSRLVGHFWVGEVDALATSEEGKGGEAGVAGCLERAFERTKGVLEGEGGWLGTTTASAAVLREGEGGEAELCVVQLGDCRVLVIRDERGKGEGEVLFKSEEQWHYFDCPHQLGTNSPDTPRENAVQDTIPVKAGDVVLAVSDGVTDNLWEHEIVDCVLRVLRAAASGVEGKTREEGEDDGGVKKAAKALVLAARAVAEDPFAESPFMERAIEEGLAVEGGKRDDISVVCARVVRREGG